MSDAEGSSAAPHDAPPEQPSTSPPVPERENIIDAVADLLQMIVNWLRQEAAGIMRDKVVLPGQQLGMLVAFAMAAAALLVIGLCFLFVAFLMVLAGYIGWPGALAVVGASILVGRRSTDLPEDEEHPDMTPDPTTQPLYIPPEERVSLDEIKQRAGTIQNLAVVQAKDVVYEVYEQNVTRAALVAVGVIIVAASLAYYIGSRAARRVVEVDLD